MSGQDECLPHLLPSISKGSKLSIDIVVYCQFQIAMSSFRAFPSPFPKGVSHATGLASATKKRHLF